MQVRTQLQRKVKKLEELRKEEKNAAAMIDRVFPELATLKAEMK